MTDIMDVPARPGEGRVRDNACSLNAAFKKVTGKPDGTVEITLSAAYPDAGTTARLFSLLPAELVSVRLEAVQGDLDLEDE